MLKRFVRRFGTWNFLWFISFFFLINNIFLEVRIMIVLYKREVMNKNFNEKSLICVNWFTVTVKLLDI